MADEKSQNGKPFAPFSIVGGDLSFPLPLRFEEPMKRNDT